MWQILLFYTVGCTNLMRGIVDWSREVCYIVSNDSTVLSGTNNIFEIEETYFGMKKYNRGRLLSEEKLLNMGHMVEVTELQKKILYCQ